MKTVYEHQMKIEKYGADAIIILTRKHNLNPFDNDVRNALIEVFQQGSIITMKVMNEIKKEEEEIAKENAELPF